MGRRGKLHHLNSKISSPTTIEKNARAKTVYSVFFFVFSETKRYYFEFNVNYLHIEATIQ